MVKADARKDYYTDLGLAPNAKLEDIKRQFKDLGMWWSMEVVKLRESSWHDLFCQLLNITQIRILGKNWNSSLNFRLFKRLMKSLVTRNSGRDMIRHGHGYILAMEDIIPRPERIRLEKPRRMNIIQRLHRNRLRVLSLSRMGRQPVPVNTPVMPVQRPSGHGGRNMTKDGLEPMRIAGFRRWIIPRAYLVWVASQILDSRLDQSRPTNTSRRLLNRGGTTRVHHAHILLPEGNRGSPPEPQVVMNPWQRTHSTTQACLERKEYQVATTLDDHRLRTDHLGLTRRMRTMRVLMSLPVRPPRSNLIDPTWSQRA